ncbi:MAG TPA: POTRA domain-containing protein [Vicinamibacterales bacterium]
MRIRASVLAALTIILAAAASRAQPPATASSLDQFLGKPIAEVRLLVEGREIHDADVAGVLETKVGAVLTTAAARESIILLMALARFEDVKVEAQITPRGIVLVYDMMPVHAVKSIEFRGDLGLPVRQLRAAVEDRYSASPPVSRAGEIAAMLEGLCRDHGFLKATVRPSTEVMHNPDRTRLTFEVSAGQPARVGTAQVEGAPDGNAGPVLLLLGLQAGARFDRVGLDSAVARYVEDLRAKGFLETKVEPDVAYSSNREQVDVTVRMARGSHVTVTFRGDPLPEKRRAEIMALLREGVLDEDVLENQERSIEDELRARGYRDGAAPFTREPRGEGQLQVVFTVTQGPQYRVAGVEVSGNQQLPRAEIQTALRVERGQWFVKARVDADAGAIRELYRRQGFRTAGVTASAVPAGADPTQLVVQFAIAEGPRTTISGIEFEHVSAVPLTVLQQAIGSQVNGPFYQPQIENDREAVLYQYQAQGYQQATVTVPQGFSQDGTRFTLRFVVEEGPQSLIDHVLIVGNLRTKTATIVREMGLQPGMPLSFVGLAGAQRRLSALGLFRKVQVTPLERNTDSRRDVVVTVEEAPVNTIGYGGGLEGALRLRTNGLTGLPEQKFDLAPRGFFEIGRRNLWGRNRSVDLFIRGAIRSSDQFNTAALPSTSSSTTVQDSGSGFREYRVLGTYREPRFMDGPIDVIVTGAIDQAIRSTFDFNRRQVYVEGSHRFGPSLSVAGRYSFGRTRLFNERIDPASQLDVDKVFSRVRLSAVSASAIRSTRDDAFEPTRGTLSALDATVAPRALGSEVGFIKGNWQGFVYKRLPALGGAVLAGGVRLGIAFGFPLTVVNPSGQVVVIEQELPASERFFAGGDTSVRGFALDQLGSRSVLDQNGVSNGGNGLVIFNVEMRFPIWRQKSLGGAAFVDTGNVFAKVSEISLGELRSGAGVGIRWKSPVGPLRLDLAWKLNPITFGKGTRESRFAWYITIGQAF